MKDLKNKLTEEQFNQLDRLIVARYVEGLSYPQRLLEAKQSGIISKSALEEAREKTDEFFKSYNSTFKADALKFIQAERQAADKKE
jgi:hypothetical protein